jgi:serine/threonine-protein kinase RsbW
MKYSKLKKKQSRDSKRIELKTNNKSSKKKFQKQLKIKSKTENLSKIRDFIFSNASMVGFSDEAIENIILAVDEACTNIIKHAYNLNPEGEIIIKLKFNGSKLLIELTDYGISFEPEKIPDPDLQKYYQQHKVGGLGMYLMKTLMDEVKYITVQGEYNQVLLTKRINQSA